MPPSHDAEGATSLLASESPFELHAVESPSIVCPRGGSPWLAYPHKDEEHHVRASFDRWDAIRVARGEYPPYPSAGGRSSLLVVENSRCLRDRYAYERQHYGTAYGLGGNVDEMLEEFEHFLFLFHDEFVEVIAAGVCFETSAAPFDLESPVRRVGLDELPASCTLERFEEHGIPIHLRKDPRSRGELLAASRLCDQALYQVALELDGTIRVTHRLTVRTQRGTTKSRWRSFNKVEARFDGVLDDPSALRPLISRYAADVAARRAARRAR
jgi:hypothetical protein